MLKKGCWIDIILEFDSKEKLRNQIEPKINRLIKKSNWIERFCYFIRKASARIPKKINQLERFFNRRTQSLKLIAQEAYLKLRQGARVYELEIPFGTIILWKSRKVKGKSRWPQKQDIKTSRWCEEIAVAAQW